MDVIGQENVASDNPTFVGIPSGHDCFQRTRSVQNPLSFKGTNRHEQNN
jgi:hypothetical protein